MRFLLGTHQTGWLGTARVPLFVSHRRLVERRTLPRAAAPWALDSGAFTELALHGGWSTSAADYVAAVRRYADEVGSLDWAAPQDWLCDGGSLRSTGLSIAEHQRRTTESYLDLRDRAPELRWVPVLQGGAPDDYLRHVELYGAHGVELGWEPLVGVGSIAARSDHRSVVDLLWRLHDDGLSVHAFGAKLSGLGMYGGALASADSLAWSYNARRNPPLDGCAHRSCSSCLRWALLWRQRVLDVLDGENLWQLSLDGC